MWPQRNRAGTPELMERETGIEPATNGLGSRYSTIELLPLGSIRAMKPIVAFQTLSTTPSRRQPTTRSSTSASILNPNRRKTSSAVDWILTDSSSASPVRHTSGKENK